MQRILRLVTKSISHVKLELNPKFMAFFPRLFYYEAGRAGFRVETELMDHISDPEPVSRLY